MTGALAYAVRGRRWAGGSGPARKLLVLVTLIVAVVVIAPGLIARHPIGEIDPAAILAGPSWSHWLGTDEAGADIFSRIVHSTRLEVALVLGSVGLALVAGIPTGLIAGYRGGLVDELLTGLATAILSFPIVLLAVLAVASYGASLSTLILVLAFVFFPRVHMLVRAQTRAIKERQFVLAARAIGSGDARILRRHILPNTIGPLSVLVPQLMATAILVEAGLSYVGLGVQPPSVTWGTLLQSSKNYYVQSPFYAIGIGAVITITAALLLVAGDFASRSANPLRRRSRA
jgi:peptide/nickel transport system permease protein